jgi:hypothetical protein
VCMGFVMSGCVYVCMGFVMRGCVYGFCYEWVCVCVGVLVISVHVFSVFCIVCTVFLYCLVYVYSYLFCPY